jgi:hypothetical protein
LLFQGTAKSKTHIFDNKVSQKEAAILCESLAGRLPLPHSDAEFERIFNVSDGQVVTSNVCKHQVLFRNKIFHVKSNICIAI